MLQGLLGGTLGLPERALCSPWIYAASVARCSFSDGSSGAEVWFLRKGGRTTSSTEDSVRSLWSIWVHCASGPAFSAKATSGAAKAHPRSYTSLTACSSRYPYVSCFLCRRTVGLCSNTGLGLGIRLLLVHYKRVYNEARRRSSIWGFPL